MVNHLISIRRAAEYQFVLWQIGMMRGAICKLAAAIATAVRLSVRKARRAGKFTDRVYFITTTIDELFGRSCKPEECTKSIMAEGRN